MVNPDGVISYIFDGKDIMADREVLKSVVNHKYSFPCGKRVGGLVAFLGASNAYYQFIDFFCNPGDYGVVPEMIRLKTPDIESSYHFRFQLQIFDLFIFNMFIFQVVIRY